MSARASSLRGDELLTRPATELAALIRQGDVSPRDLVARTLERVHALQPKLNAFVKVGVDEAVARAEWAEQQVISGQPLGPLHGVPFTVKDIIPVGGYPLTYGSKLFRDNVARRDSVCVKRLRRAGAILIGTTTTSEMGHKALTDSPLYGTTPNPWDLERTPGGSSGGGAVAVATGMGPLAFGTDGAGSVRIPASCCGLVGLKPTLGVIPRDYDTDAFGTLSHIGVLSRTVADAALAMNVVAGTHPNDPYSYGARPQNYLTACVARGDLKGTRIAWMPRIGNGAVDSEVMDLPLSRLRALEDLGARVEERFLDLRAAANLLFTLNPVSSFVELGDRLAAEGQDLDPSFREAVESGAKVTSGELHRALLGRTAIFRSIQRLFDEFDFVVTPTLTAPPLRKETKAWEDIEINAETHSSGRFDWYCFLHPFNHSGHPAVSVPAGWTRSGLPVGVQIVGPWHSDVHVLRMAAEVEAILPWRDRWPPILTKL
jgi:aspartyl-tRNA(Asn)/glutamyl-tRNA(Gln) amidotransferase subunit A